MTATTTISGSACASGNGTGYGPGPSMDYVHDLESVGLGLCNWRTDAKACDRASNASAGLPVLV